ncbi:ku70-like protein [Wolfiporia cocos MD-104 SS10]|uniref:ATP-dependent DNA helicase II subunit 1 n=1 Tax=Wolfiporia cocos (strain MD-104) TaxID=742152 RepID=A0A2H3JKG2_WOLCO|nr:ku70-like protein [Wolfiporia cocos MD-104 SS10]
MAPFDDWNRIEDDDEEELQDISYLESKRDVILFCIDCSPSMLELYEDPIYEDVQTCHLLTALEAAMQVQKKKVIVGPNDAVGILLFNTGLFLYQPIETINAPKIQELMQLIDAARQDPEHLRKTFPPQSKSRVPMGDVFTKCNRAIRDGVPKTATKRVFLITDEDNPHPEYAKATLDETATTTLTDLLKAGINVEPFFISTEEKQFDIWLFYGVIYPLIFPTGYVPEEGNADGAPLPDYMSITRIDELLSEMRFHEVPKRALFSVPMQLAEGFVIGVKGYGMITERKKGSYKYFADLGDRMEVVQSKTKYIDEERQTEVDQKRVLHGMTLGDDADKESEAEANGGTGSRVVSAGSKVFYTADEIRSFRTMGLEPMIKLLGFKPRDQLAFEDNIKHSIFIYPDEKAYYGSNCTFSALLRTMLKKNKIAIVLALTRRNASPMFCAMLPQEEQEEEGGWHQPSGFHLIPLPFADDIRAAPIERSIQASEETVTTARVWVDLLTVKDGAYPPDAYPNPALAYHNAQLEASAFREEFDPSEFEDLTLPKYDRLHKRAGDDLKRWKLCVLRDKASTSVDNALTSKRKAEFSVDEAEIRSKYEEGQMGRVWPNVHADFLRSKSQPISGKKAELIERTTDWLNIHA